ncbi:MAG: hypothetical protein ACM3QS_17935 [Bacteroidota bacterium]
MTEAEAFEDRLDTVTWGLLALVWGLTILVAAVPFGAGLVGSGLVLLGVNATLLRRGLETSRSNTVLGVLGLCWGALELARPILHQVFKGADLDWVIFAILLVIWGSVQLGRGALTGRGPGRPAG